MYIRFLIQQLNVPLSTLDPRYNRMSLGQALWKMVSFLLRPSILSIGDAYKKQTDLSLLSLMQILESVVILDSQLLYPSLEVRMRSQNQKIHGSQYIQLKDIKESRLEKLADNISAKTKALQELKSRILNQEHPVKKDTTDFKREINGLKDILDEFNTIDAVTESQKRLKQRTIKATRTFLQNLHPEQVQNKMATVQLEMSRKVEQQQQQQLTLSPNQRQELESDRQYLKEIQEAVAVVKNMSVQIGSLVHKQGEQLTLIANNMGSASNNMKNAKSQVKEGVTYQQDTNKKTFMCCILITVIVLLILMVVYATHK